MEHRYPLDLNTLPEWYELPPINSGTSIHPLLVDDLLNELNCISPTNAGEIDDKPSANELK